MAGGLVKRRLVGIPHARIRQQPPEKTPVVLHIGARGPGTEIARGVPRQTKSVGRQTQKKVRKRIPGKNSTGKLILPAVVEIQRSVKWKISNRRAEFRYRARMLPGDVIENFETSIPPLLRKIGRMTQ